MVQGRRKGRGRGQEGARAGRQRPEKGRRRRPRPPQVNAPARPRPSMPIHNNDVAGIFDELADLLEIKGENQFRVRAYRNAARTVSSLSRSVAELAREEKGLDGIPGIGKDLADKIRTIVATGKLPLLEDTRKELPAGLSALMKVRGLGPKKIAALYKVLKVASIGDLKNAATGA